MNKEQLKDLFFHFIEPLITNYQHLQQKYHSHFHDSFADEIPLELKTLSYFNQEAPMRSSKSGDGREGTLSADPETLVEAESEEGGDEKIKFDAAYDMTLCLKKFIQACNKKSVD